MGLWRQLVNPNVEHTAGVRRLWKDHHDGSTPITEKRLGDVIAILKEAIENSSQTFILVDGVDELPDHTCTRLLQILKTLQGSKICNILATSRYSRSIGNLFKVDPQFELIAQKDDLLVYVKARAQTPPFEKLRTKISDLDNIILENVIPKCKNMFLLARLYMDALSHAAEKVNSFYLTIQKLPAELDKVYFEAMERIKREQQYAESAIDVLFWIAFATRPLSVSELRTALAIEPGNVEYDEGNELLLDITSICAGLIVIDPKNDTIRLAHYTTEEYLKRSYHAWAPKIHGKITSRMLTYLSFKSFQNRLEGDAVLDDMYLKFPFLQYASLNWGIYLETAMESQSDVQLQAQAFLQQDFRLSDLILKSRIEELTDRDRFVGSLPGNVTSLHIAAFFDLQDFVPMLQAHERDHPSRNPLAISPLNFACTMSRVKFAERLLDGGADVHGIPGFAWRPIHQAARFCKSGEMITLLLDYGADINSLVTIDPGDDIGYRYGGGQTALHEAAFWGNLEAVKVLVQRGSDVDFQSQANVQADGRQENETLLPAQSSTPDEKDWNDQTPLGWALQQQHHDVAELLRKTVALDTGSRNYQGQTLRSGATEDGEEESSRSLLKTLENTNKLVIQSPPNAGSHESSLEMVNGNEIEALYVMDDSSRLYNSTVAFVAAPTQRKSSPASKFSDRIPTLLPEDEIVPDSVEALRQLPAKTSAALEIEDEELVEAGGVYFKKVWGLQNVSLMLQLYFILGCVLFGVLSAVLRLGFRLPLGIESSWLTVAAIACGIVGIGMGLQLQG